MKWFNSSSSGSSSDEPKLLKIERLDSSRVGESGYNPNHDTSSLLNGADESLFQNNNSTASNLQQDSPKIIKGIPFKPNESTDDDPEDSGRDNNILQVS